MKTGLQVGNTAEIEITVGPDMVAAFEGHTVHPLYSTSHLVHHMEWAARKTILPYLEQHEEGMGSMVEVHHLMFTPVGMQVTVRATVTAVHEKKVECAVEAFNTRGKIARGVVVQAIIQKSWLERKIREMEVVDGIAREQSIH